MTQHKDRIEHTLEVLVLAPIGVGPVHPRHGPDVREHVRRARAGRGRSPAGSGAAANDDREEHRPGRDDVRRPDGTPAGRARSRQRASARADVPRLDRRVRRTGTEVRTEAARPSRLAAAPAPAAAPGSIPAAPKASEANGAQTNGSNGSAAGDSLPIPGYDALSASQVVERLAGLSPTELDAVRSYEGAHRKRRTILGKIDQISA